MKSFFIKFNVIWLGGLFFSLLFLSGIQHSARFSPSDSLAWSTKYLDGISVSLVMIGLLLISLFSWGYALYKSWHLTKSEKMISTQRLFVFSYLLGVPVFLKFTGIYWLSAIRIITDRLVHLIWCWWCSDILLLQTVLIICCFSFNSLFSNIS